MNIDADTHREEALKDQPSSKRDTAERFAGRHRSRKILGLQLWVRWLNRFVVKEEGRELQNFD